MCYNAPKSHWLGWYEEFHQALDPVETPSKLVELVGLADCDEALSFGNVESQAIVLRIDMYEGQSLCKSFDVSFVFERFHVTYLTLTIVPFFS